MPAAGAILAPPKARQAAGADFASPAAAPLDAPAPAAVAAPAPAPAAPAAAPAAPVNTHVTAGQHPLLPISRVEDQPAPPPGALPEPIMQFYEDRGWVVTGESWYPNGGSESQRRMFDAAMSPQEYKTAMAKAQVSSAGPADPWAMPAGDAGVDKYGRMIAQNVAPVVQEMGRHGLGLVGDYLNIYKPYDNKLMGYVDHLGSEGYRQSQRGHAMNAVQMQADAALQQMQRQALATGVNLADPRYAFMTGQLAQQAALGKVGAAADSDRSAREDWLKGLGAVNAMGLKVNEQGLKYLDQADDLARLGLASMDTGANALERGKPKATGGGGGGNTTVKMPEPKYTQRDIELQDRDYTLKLIQMGYTAEQAEAALNNKPTTKDVATGALIQTGVNLLPGVVDKVAGHIFSGGGSSGQPNQPNDGGAPIVWGPATTPAPSGWSTEDAGWYSA